MSVGENASLDKVVKQSTPYDSYILLILRTALQSLGPRSSLRWGKFGIELRLS